jgi:hypothetical protein
MLGRLRMSIEDAIEAYKSLSPSIFRKKWWTSKKVLRLAAAENQTYWFKGDDLKVSVQRLLEERGFDPEVKLLEADIPSCRV